MSRPALGLSFALGVLLLVGISAAAQQATEQPKPDGMDEVVAELRKLRVAIENASRVQSSLQLTVQRADVQEERLWRVSRELVTLREAVAKEAGEVSEAAAGVKRFEDALGGSELDPVERKQVEREMIIAKARQERREQALQSLRQQEAAMEQTVRAEEDTWRDFNLKLDELERLLGQRTP